MTLAVMNFISLLLFVGVIPICVDGLGKLKVYCHPLGQKSVIGFILTVFILQSMLFIYLQWDWITYGALADLDNLSAYLWGVYNWANGATVISLALLLRSFIVWRIQE